MSEKENNCYFENEAYIENYDKRQSSSARNSQKMEEITSMEDLLKAAGTKGWRNYLIFFFCAWASFVSPMHTLSYQFLGATPEYWCDVPQLQESNWTIEQIVNFSVPYYSPDDRLESCSMNDLDYNRAAQMTFEEALLQKEDLIKSNKSVDCDKRFFDPTEPDTVVTKWDLVCNRRVLYSTTQATVHVGKLVGSAIMGYLMNMFGRKRVLVVCIPLYLLVGIVTAWSPNVEVYITLKFIISTLAMSFYLGGMVLSFEICSTSQRSLIGALFAVPWAIGYMVLPGIAYLVRPFLQLQIAVTLPVLTIFPCLWILPESPRWFVLKGRFDEAIGVLEKLAHFNKRKLPPKESMVKYMSQLHKESQKSNKEENSVIASLRRLAALFTNTSWLWKIIILFFSWFSASLVYYGVSLNPPDLSQDKYLYIFLGGALEIPSYILLWPANKYFGRKKSLVALYATCAVAIFVAAGLTLQGEKSSSTHSWLLFLSLLGKFAITAAFQLVWIYTTELIPTEQRTEVVGASSSFARLGSISSPYIVDLLGELAHWAPSAIFGSFSIVTAVLIIFLPETRNLNLAESM